MDFIDMKKEQYEKEIFKDHVATRISAGPAEIIEWRKPGTGYYSVSYVLFEDSMMVKGDMGEAVYRDFGGMSFEELAAMNLNSFTKRLSAFCDNRWDFDPRTASEELEDCRHLFTEEEQEEAMEVIREVINDYSDFEGYHFGLGEVLNDFELEGEDIAILCNLGRRLPGRLIAYWVGLQMATEQLKGNQAKSA